MKKRWIFAPVLLVVGFAMLAVGGAVDSTAPDKNHKDKKKASDCLCPIYPWAYHEGYWSYYAVYCSTNEPTNLDAEPEANGQCPNSNSDPCAPDCIPVITSDAKNTNSAKAIKLGDSHYWIQIKKHPKGNGIGKNGFKRERKKGHGLQTNSAIATHKATYVVKVVDDTKKKKKVIMYAELKFYVVAPLGKKPLNARIGYQIKKPGSIDGNATIVHAPSDRKFLLVSFGGAYYRVLCHKSYTKK